jgi:hypothetical protein
MTERRGIMVHERNQLRSSSKLIAFLAPWYMWWSRVRPITSEIGGLSAWWRSALGVLCRDVRMDNDASLQNCGPVHIYYRSQFGDS